MCLLTPTFFYISLDTWKVPTDAAKRPRSWCSLHSGVSNDPISREACQKRKVHHSHQKKRNAHRWRMGDSARLDLMREASVQRTGACTHRTVCPRDARKRGAKSRSMNGHNARARDAAHDVLPAADGAGPLLPPQTTSSSEHGGQGLPQRPTSSSRFATRIASSGSFDPG